MNFKHWSEELSGDREVAAMECEDGRVELMFTNSDGVCRSFFLTQDDVRALRGVLFEAQR